MSNMHRLIWFDKQVRALVYPNRCTLADKFELSVRQAQRDIDYLKNSMEAPIRYDAKRRGYYYEDESYILPNVFINDLQKRMLKFLAYRYENYTQTPKVAQMSELFRKLAEEGDIDDEIPIFDLGKPVVQSYYAIYNAISSRNKLKLIYRDPYKGNISLKLDPYKLFFKYNADHLVGYDSELQELATLRLDRIMELTVLAESFTVSPHFEEKKYSGFVEKEPYTAKVRFTSEPHIKADKGIRIRPLEGFIYEIQFYDAEELINLLICNSCWDKVFSPKWLNQKVIERCQDIIERLKD